ncbi:PspC domain-containing protein, partial [Spirillospora sp. NPDC049652]
MGERDESGVGAPAGPGRARLERARRGRLVAGVCRGLAEHLGIDVLLVRAAF